VLLRRLDQLIHLTAKLMQLSRVEAGLGLAREPVDLELLARMVVRDFNAPGEQARLVLETSELPSWAMGDVDALGIALRNLIENALRHSGGSTVTVRVEPYGVVSVEDEGEGVDADALARLRQPFQRGSSKAEGHGLGLSIVDAVAQQSGGTLELESPLRPGRGGFRASLRLDPAP
jgi:two-component system OmpR family sensor kinase